MDIKKLQEKATSGDKKSLFKLVDFYLKRISENVYDEESISYLIPALKLGYEKASFGIQETLLYYLIQDFYKSSLDTPEEQNKFAQAIGGIVNQLDNDHLLALYIATTNIVKDTQKQNKLTNEFIKVYLKIVCSCLNDYTSSIPQEESIKYYDYLIELCTSDTFKIQNSDDFGYLCYIYISRAKFYLYVTSDSEMAYANYLLAEKNYVYNIETPTNKELYFLLKTLQIDLSKTQSHNISDIKTIYAISKSFYNQLSKEDKQFCLASYLEILNNVSTMLCESNETDEGVKALKEAQQLANKFTEKDFNDIYKIDMFIISNINLADYLQKIGQLADSLQYYDIALKVLCDAPTPQSFFIPRICAYTNSCVSALIGLKDYTTALDLTKQVINYCKKDLATLHLSYFKAVLNYALVCMATKDLKDGINIYNEYLTYANKDTFKDNEVFFNCGFICLSLSVIYGSHLHDHKNERKFLQKSFNYLLKAEPSNHTEALIEEVQSRLVKTAQQTN